MTTMNYQARRHALQTRAGTLIRARELTRVRAVKNILTRDIELVYRELMVLQAEARDHYGLDNDE